jgi:mannosyl-oligosaccharide alpha-1,2-mannosidase
VRRRRRRRQGFDGETCVVRCCRGAAKNWNWAAGGCAILSELGTMHLEFQYLSQLTGNDVYLQKVGVSSRVARRIALMSVVSRVRSQAEKIRQTLRAASDNGMYYNYISQDTGKWCQSRRDRSSMNTVGLVLVHVEHASLGALGDSFYEYLLKSWILSGKKDEQARSMFEGAMKVSCRWTRLARRARALRPFRLPKRRCCARRRRVT